MTRQITGRLITGDGVTIQISDGLIAAVEPCPMAAGPFVGAGLVDLQVNGYAGLDLNHAPLKPERVVALTHALFRHGVTTFLPTLITASPTDLLDGITAIRQARDMDPLVAHVVAGIHLEGPFIAPDDGTRGAHPLEHVRGPDLAEVRSWQDAAGGLVRIVTLSPHSEQAIALVGQLVAMGIHVAIGHTTASPEQVHAAADAGATLSTHLGNGTPSTLARHPNFVWAQLADDRLTASFIADGHHLPVDTFKAMVRAKGEERSILVSDVAAAGGLAPGLHVQPIGGMVELRADGRLGIAGTPYLAGAALTLDHCIGRAVRAGELSMPVAYEMATRGPGRFVGGRGTLDIGSAADLITFDWTDDADRIAVLGTMVRGQWVWQRQ